MGFRFDYLREVKAQTLDEWGRWQKLAAVGLALVTAVAWLGLAARWWPSVITVASSALLVTLFVWKFVIDVPARMWRPGREPIITVKGAVRLDDVRLQSEARYNSLLVVDLNVVNPDYENMNLNFVIRASVVIKQGTPLTTEIRFEPDRIPNAFRQGKDRVILGSPVFLEARGEGVSGLLVFNVMDYNALILDRATRVELVARNVFAKQDRDNATIKTLEVLDLRSEGDV